METTQVQQHVPDFQVFKGPNHRKMPKLIANGLVPASGAELMLGFLRGKIDCNRHHDSGDAIIYHPDKRVKLVWDSEDLRKLNKKSPLNGLGNLVLPSGSFESIEGRVFSSDEVKKYVEVYAKSKDDVVGNPFWQWLARDDKKLLEEYAGQMFGLVKERHGIDYAMCIRISDPRLDTPALQLWSLGGVKYNVGKAFTRIQTGYYSFGGRLAGVGNGVARKRKKR